MQKKKKTIHKKRRNVLNDPGYALIVLVLVCTVKTNRATSTPNCEENNIFLSAFLFFPFSFLFYIFDFVRFLLLSNVKKKKNRSAPTTFIFRASNFSRRTV